MVEPSCTFSGHLKWPCLVCCLFKAFADSMGPEWTVSYSFKSCCTLLVHSNLFLLAVSSDWPFLAVCTSPGEKATDVDGVCSEGSDLQWSSALSGQIKSRTFGMLVMARKPFSVGLQWCTSHASQDFILFTVTVVSTIRLVILHGVPTLRIKCTISEIYIGLQS